MGPIERASLCLWTPVTTPTGLLLSRDSDSMSTSGSGHSCGYGSNVNNIIFCIISLKDISDEKLSKLDISNCQ
jgi:hypothetical protein